ncbi:MAG: hypothetical protein AB8H80_12725, partial [Planctomycetota bacterium]
QHVGVLAIPAVLRTLHGWTRGLRWPLLATAFYAACFAVVGIWPDDGSRTLADGAPDSIAYVLMSSVTWTVLGALLLTLLRGGLPFVLRRRMPRGRRRRLFLAAWVVSEIAGSFVVSPFPAARRVMVVAIALTVAAGWYCSRRTRCQSSGGGGGGWGLAAAVSLTLGFGIQSLDYIEADAWVEAAAEVADYAAKRDPAAEIYFVGGWGFEFYAPRAGLLPLLEQRVQLQPGDLVAVGSIDGIESAWFEPDPRLPQIDEMWFGSDAVPFSTQFSYYSGQRPIDGQVGPRYRVRILRASEALHTSELRTIPNEWKSRGPQ